jgi:hypothetical protein
LNFLAQDIGDVVTSSLAEALGLRDGQNKYFFFMIAGNNILLALNKLST